MSTILFGLVAIGVICAVSGLAEADVRDVKGFSDFSALFAQNETEYFHSICYPFSLPNF